ncbi:N-acetylmuramoyl-L-alanine amidase family protein [Bacillus sp. Fil]|uniref:N-acetylmuramoyl-L-alanine amidase family protein n=1 Tax=Bacillus sp. Fil TaxID=3459567 RepID=UPI00403AF0ED
MKYKDRKDAKRKYKQALLATVATMTLGVSALGGTAPAFAASPDMGKIFDEGAKSLTKKLADNKLEKFGIGIINAEGKAIATGLSTGDKYKLTRDLMIGITAAIPVGGSFISTYLSFVMADPETNPVAELKKQIAQMKDDITRETNQKFIDLIQTHLDSLDELTLTFENSVNSGIKSGSYYSSIEDSNATVAREINQKFKDIIKECTSPSLQTELLPLYTNVATAHLIFLQFMENNKTGNSKLSIDSETYNTYIKKDVDEDRKNYIQYIQNTYKKYNDSFSEKMKKLATDNGLEYSTDDQAILSQIANKKAAMEARNNAKMEMAKNLNGSGIVSALEDTKDLVQAEKDCKDIIDKKNKYYTDTVANPGFNQGAKWGLVKDNDGKMYYYDIDGKKKNGWQQVGNKWYLFNTTDNTMRTGLVDEGGRTYYLKPDTGEMKIGWSKIEDKWYYFSPTKDNKNYEQTVGLNNGATFNEGQMMYGWLKTPGDADYEYYASPTDAATNEYQPNGKKFKKGEMWTGWLQWTGVKGSHWYYLNDSTGKLIRNQNIVTQPSGKSHHFDAAGKNDD